LCVAGNPDIDDDALASNVTLAPLHIAADIVRIDAVSNELSPRYRASLPQLEWCEANGVAFMAWRPFGGLAPAERSRNAPFHDMAVARGISPHRLAAARLLHKAPNVTVLAGATRPETIRDSLAAASVILSEDDIAMLDRTLPLNRP
jgi:aryl-alcohol dehydrogenase-like predicted oxidoreductase